MMKKYLLALLLSLTIAPAAFADEVTEDALTTDATAVTTTTEDTMLCGGGCGYWGGIYLNVNTTVSAEVTAVSLYGNYYIDNALSKEDAIDELNAVYADMSTTLSKYGTVVRTGIYTYADWEYTGYYDGSVSIRLDLNNPTQTESVENVFYKKGFDVWRDIKVDNTAAERSAVASLKDMLADKKEVYEDFLGSMLGSISNLSIYSWADTTSYNSATNMVNVYVYADVTYNMMGN